MACHLSEKNKAQCGNQSISLKLLGLKNFRKRSAEDSNNCCATRDLTDEDFHYFANYMKLSREDAHEMHQNFLLRHPDGKITIKAFRNMMPKTDCRKLEQHIFRMYDTDGNGRIDFREFMLVLHVLMHGTPEDNLKQIFRIFDIDNDGSITQQEMVGIVKALYHLLNQDDNPQRASERVIANMAFQEMDADQDGLVTLEEFIRACTEHKKISSMLTLKLIDVFI